MESFVIDGLTVRPLQREIWPAFEMLFGPKGAYAGCWCMWWRLSRREFEKGQGEGNRRAMKAIVDSGTVPGLIAFLSDEPVGWCSVAPREQYDSLERSRVLKRVDDKAVWSLVCFFVKNSQRGYGLSEKLIRGAIAYVRERGGKIIEAYPTVIRKAALPPVSSFMGIPKVFIQLGFREVSRPSQSKLIMRYEID